MKEFDINNFRTLATYNVVSKTIEHLFKTVALFPYFIKMFKLKAKKGDIWKTTGKKMLISADKFIKALIDFPRRKMKSKTIKKIKD